MEIRETPVNINPGTSKQSEPDITEKAIRDKFSFSQKDLSPDGMLTLIIMPGDSSTGRALKQACCKSGFGRFKEDLDIINGFTYQISPDELIKFIKLLPEDANITIDHPVSFFSPIFKQSPEKQFDQNQQIL